MQEESVLYTTY